MYSLRQIWLIMISVLALSFSLNAQSLDMRQILTLKTVKNIAMQTPDKDGKTFEDTMMAICLVESSGGKLHYGDKQLLQKGIKKGSYGVMQVQLSTARFVAKQFDWLEVKGMKDVVLIKKLMHDTVFCVKVATLYVVWLSEHSKSYFEMVSRYNGGKVNHPYFIKIKKAKAILKPYTF